MFTKKSTTSALYKALSAQYLNRMYLGEAKHTDEKALELLGFKAADMTFPALIAIPPSFKGDTDPSEDTFKVPVLYDGAIKQQAVKAFFDQYALPDMSPGAKKAEPCTYTNSVSRIDTKSCTALD